VDQLQLIIESSVARICLRDPIPEIFEAAKYLDDVVTAHLDDRRDVADDLIRHANMPVIREWALVHNFGSLFGTTWVEYESVRGRDS
jgi:hypothetical protein